MLSVHDRKQSLMAGLQRKGVQSVAPLSRQVPLPSQVRALIRSLPLQEAAAHWVPAGWKRQLPAPSQVPSWPQVDGAPAMQDGEEAPAGSWWHRPRKPETLQLRQVPQLSASQQTPSVHWPLPHWPSPVQAKPRGASWQVEPMQVSGGRQSAVLAQGEPLLRWPQAPARQVLGATQSASLPQPAKQAAPLHR
jgi:hypothetical protein